MIVSAQTSQNEIVSGSVEKITFRNHENGFSVLQIRSDSNELSTITGLIQAIEVGEYVECSGEWKVDKTFGKQFKASRILPVQPKTNEALEKFLSSGLIKGVGPKLAKRLVKTFREDLFDVLTNEPSKLLSVPGFTDARVQSVSESWAKHKETSEIILFLSSVGLTTAQSLKIAELYGQNTIEIVTNQPYRLAIEVEGISFRIADEVAQSVGLDPNSQLRAQAGLQHILKDLASEGSSACEKAHLFDRAKKLLAVENSLLDDSLQIGIASGMFVAESFSGKSLVFLAKLYAAEVKVAEAMKRLTRTSGVKTRQIAVNQQAFEQTVSEMKLSASQRVALQSVIQHKVLIITGGPGVGKTTLIRALLCIAREDEQLAVVLCAPTGRAAKRLSEAAGQPAKTIHRLLEYEHQNGFKRNGENPLETDLLIVDEASMIDLKLMSDLLCAVPSDAQLVLVGDIDQLPSVGPGAVLANFISSKTVEVVHLTEVFRQEQTTSLIVANAHRINRGEMPTVDKTSGVLSDYYFIRTTSDERTRELIIKMVAENVPRMFGLDPIKEIQVLTPMKKGDLGSLELNLRLKARLNGTQAKSVYRGGFQYSVGDKVIQTVNDYDKGVFNGDLGIICDINMEDTEVLIDYSDKVVKYSFPELDAIALAYATSIHKSQGSEYPAVIIPLTMQHALMLERNLLYTAVTRAKKVVVLIGQDEALRLAVGRKRSHKRISGLSSRLRQYLPQLPSPRRTPNPH